MLLCILSFVGCAPANIDSRILEPNAFRILRQVDNDEKITLSYVFPVNSDRILELGFSDVDVKTYRFYLSTYVNTLASNNREKAGDGVRVSNCVYYADVDGVGFSIEFENLDAQKKFFGIQDDENSNIDREFSGFFMKKLKMSSNFPVSSVASATQIKLVCSMATVSWCSQNNISQEKREKLEKILDDSIFIYDSASTSNTLKSEVMYEGNGLFHNVFIKSMDEIENDNKITFYYSYPNAGVWYLFALGGVVLGMIIAYFVLKNLKKENKNKEKQ